MSNRCDIIIFGKWKKYCISLFDIFMEDVFMEASPMSLFEKFIKEAYGSQYVIPVYQRNYTWKKNKQVKQLLDDVEKIITGQVKRHFIGTIVYVIVKTDFIVRERAVVDGQQRLITMFLIAHALRKIANDQGNLDISKILTSSYLENIDSQGDYKYRLKPSVADDNAYKLIAEQKYDEILQSSSKVGDSYLYLEERLKEMVTAHGLMNVINAIRELYVVRIELDEADNAQQIFESINSTGEKLTAADLIRNYIMMNKANDIQEEIYKKYWLPMEKIFPESKNMEEFFRLYLAAKTYVLISIKDLYEEFKGFWQTEKLNNEEKEILNDILVYANHFNRLYISAKKDDLGEVLYDFRKMQSVMPAPFLMQVLEHLKNGEVNITQTKEIIQLISGYLIRRYFAGQDSSAITRFFPTYLKNIMILVEKHGYGQIIEICKYLLIDDTKRKASFMPDDDQLKQYLTTANAYVLQLTKWLLEKIENYKSAILVDTSVLSIEHVMPQTQNDYWTRISGLTKEDYEGYVNRIGNLTLAARTDNSRMSNNNFDYKKEVLKNTGHLKINEDILTKDIWDVDCIEKRTVEIIDKILVMYPYTKSNIDFYELDKKDRQISLIRADIEAEGFLEDDDSITVYSGSTIRYSTKPSAASLVDLREELLEKEITIYENGVYRFDQDYTFSSPSAASDFILGGSTNGWDCWRDINGEIINFTLRKKK